MKGRCSKCRGLLDGKGRYCKRCDRERKRTARTSPTPRTEEERNTRRVTDGTFAYLHANPGATITIGGVTVQSHNDGTVSFPALTQDQKGRIQQFLSNK